MNEMKGVPAVWMKLKMQMCNVWQMRLELFVSMTQKVSQCMNDSMYENEWWKMMNVTNVHACYEKPKHKEMTKVKKCKCVVALRYVWQKKCGKCEKCKHAVALWYMWQKEMCWNTRKVLKKKCIKHVTKRNGNVLENRNDKCESASVW